MSLLAHQLELLSPAKTAEIGREAILHGADAVYIGGPAFGARHNASNSIEEISSLVEFAHRYRSRIFVTINTILHDAELEAARKQIWQLYEAGVDALIVRTWACWKWTCRRSSCTPAPSATSARWKRPSSSAMSAFRSCWRAS
jgi:collagenase-like PrtC family protease